MSCGVRTEGVASSPPASLIRPHRLSFFGSPACNRPPPGWPPHPAQSWKMRSTSSLWPSSIHPICMPGHDRSGPARVHPRHHHDRQIRDLDTRVGRKNQRIIPTGDRAEKDAGKGLAREPDPVDSRKVAGQDDHTRRQRELQDLVPCPVRQLSGQGLIGSRKIEPSFDEAVDARPGADR